jgi:hypothetical protein
MVTGSHRLLGEILCDMGYATQDQINQALERQAMVDPSQSPPLIGEILVQMGVVTDDQVREALVAQGKTTVGSTSHD